MILHYGAIFLALIDITIATELKPITGGTCTNEGFQVDSKENACITLGSGHKKDETCNDVQIGHCKNLPSPPTDLNWSILADKSAKKVVVQFNWKKPLYGESEGHKIRIVKTGPTSIGQESCFVTRDKGPMFNLTVDMLTTSATYEAWCFSLPSRQKDRMKCNIAVPDRCQIFDIWKVPKPWYCASIQDVKAYCSSKKVFVNWTLPNTTQDDDVKNAVIVLNHYMDSKCSEVAKLSVAWKDTKGFYFDPVEYGLYCARVFLYNATTRMLGKAGTSVVVNCIPKVSVVRQEGLHTGLQVTFGLGPVAIAVILGMYCLRKWRNRNPRGRGGHGIPVVEMQYQNLLNQQKDQVDQELENDPNLPNLSKEETGDTREFAQVRLFVEQESEDDASDRGGCLPVQVSSDDEEDAIRIYGNSQICLTEDKESTSVISSWPSLPINEVLIRSTSLCSSIDGLEMGESQASLNIKTGDLSGIKLHK